MCTKKKTENAFYNHFGVGIHICGKLFVHLKLNHTAIGLPSHILDWLLISRRIDFSISISTSTRLSFWLKNKIMGVPPPTFGRDLLPLKLLDF